MGGHCHQGVSRASRHFRMPSAVSGGLGRSEGQRGEEGSLGVPHRGNGLLLGGMMLPEHWSQPVAGARAGQQLGDPAPFLQLVGSRDLTSENPRVGEGMPALMCPGRGSRAPQTRPWRMSRNQEGGEKRDIQAGEEPAWRGPDPGQKAQAAGLVCQSPECQAKAGVRQPLLSYRCFAPGRPAGKAAGTRGCPVGAARRTGEGRPQGLQPRDPAPARGARPVSVRAR